MKARQAFSGEAARDINATICKYAPHFEPFLSVDRVVITEEKYRHKRTPPQNARYWAILTALGNEVGHTKEEMHEEVLCEKFEYEIVEFRGWQRKRPKKRSSNLTTVEFAELMAIAERWAVEAGVFWEDVA